MDSPQGIRSGMISRGASFSLGYDRDTKLNELCIVSFPL